MMQTGNTHIQTVKLAKEELGVSKPGKYLEKESWWWNEDVQQAVREKKEVFESLQLARLEQDRDHSQKESNTGNAIRRRRLLWQGQRSAYKDLEENGASNSTSWLKQG